MCMIKTNIVLVGSTNVLKGMPVIMPMGRILLVLVVPLVTVAKTSKKMYNQGT